MTKTVHYIIGERAGETARLLFTWTGAPEAGIRIAQREAAERGQTFDRIVAERVED